MVEPNSMFLDLLRVLEDLRKTRSSARRHGALCITQRSQVRRLKEKAGASVKQGAVRLSSSPPLDWDKSADRTFLLGASCDPGEDEHSFGCRVLTICKVFCECAPIACREAGEDELDRDFGRARSVSRVVEVREFET